MVETRGEGPLESGGKRKNTFCQSWKKSYANEYTTKTKSQLNAQRKTGLKENMNRLFHVGAGCSLNSTRCLAGKKAHEGKSRRG